ncbi:hypothetical protein V8C37DRAFT_179389 [Trichoderma ceciliae]
MLRGALAQAQTGRARLDGNVSRKKVRMTSTGLRTEKQFLRRAQKTRRRPTETIPEVGIGRGVDVAMVLTGPERIDGRERKEVGGREVGGEANKCFRSLWLSGSGTGQPVRSCSPAACGARAAWQWVTIDLRDSSASRATGQGGEGGVGSAAVQRQSRELRTSNRYLLSTWQWSSQVGTCSRWRPVLGGKAALGLVAVPGGRDRAQKAA